MKPSIVVAENTGDINKSNVISPVFQESIVSTTPALTVNTKMVPVNSKSKSNHPNKNTLVDACKVFCQCFCCCCLLLGGS